LVTTSSLEENAQLPIEALESRLGTSPAGLSSEEVEERLAEYGPNEFARKKKRFVLFEFFAHFKSPLVLILLFAGLISIIVAQDVVDASIIFAIIFISISLDFYQESKAEKAADALKEKVSTTATVIRDNEKQEVKLAEIVPGDLIYLSAGDIVPADSRIIDAKDLFVDQSTLTGESFPIEKTPKVTLEKRSIITEWRNCVFMGTSIVSGSATAVVVNTGGNSEFGKIAKHLIAREGETEFEKSARRFGYLIIEVTLVLVIFVFFIIALLRKEVLQSFLFALALAVGLTPEFLPMIISLNLSRGSIEMAKKGVIVKRLTRIQNFGSMDVLCTDKTGTLTENKISLVQHIDYAGNENEKVLRYSFLNSYFQTGLKSPLDNAILAYKDIKVQNYQKIDEIPFDFTRKRVSIVVAHGEKHNLLVAKGAPEEILKVCSACEVQKQVDNLTGDLRRKIQRKFNDLSADGFRALGVAYKRIPVENRDYTTDDEDGMTFLGFVAFLDPPKESAKESLQLLKQTGIEVKIVTGDNELVARKVCEELKFQVKGVLLGDQILYMHDDALQRAIERTNIFARVTPGQKSRILNALKQNGHVVGFLGDGINDATSIKNADVGISVENAVDVAKEAADIILVEKRLRVLYDGVLEGRKTFGNTMKYLLMGTSSNFGNMFSVAIAAIFLPFLPMLPIQILLNNLLYDLSETTIPTDNVDEDSIQRPTKLDISFIRRFMTIVGPISSIFDILTFLIVIFVFNWVAINPTTGLVSATQPLFWSAWFIESMCTQTLVIFVLRTKKTPFYKSKPGKAITFSSLSVVAAAIIIPFTPLGTIFQFGQPPWQFFIFLAGMVIFYLYLVESVKKWFYKRYGHLLEKSYTPITIFANNTQRKRL